MVDIRQTLEALVKGVLEGEGKASPADRRAAFDNAALVEPLKSLIEMVVKQAHKITDADIAASRASGFSEDQIFEIVVCGAIGQAARQHDAALAALNAATKKE